MTSEFWIRVSACRWCLAAVLALLAFLLAPSRAQAQVQTFFVNVPATSEQRDAMELCRDRFTAALVRVGGFRANQDAVTQQSVTDCLGENASATAKRECEVSMANIEVDFLILPTVRRLGEQWNWGIKALSPAQGAAQVWGGDQRVGGDAAEAAYEACDALGREFACAQGVAQACVGSGFGAGPLLTNSSQGAGETASPARGRSRVAVSALDVFDVTPSEVTVWIDGKESGTSANQVTGIPPGEREVTLKATGYFDHSQRLTFAAGKPTVLRGIRLRKTTASLFVAITEPADATVFVGGREMGRTGTRLAGIAPVPMEVVIRAPGYQDRREQVVFVADEEARLELNVMIALPATLTVSSNVMGAEVFIDGLIVGETTGEDDAFEVAHTARRLEVRRDGYQRFSQSLALRPGGAVRVSVSLQRTAAASTLTPPVSPKKSAPVSTSSERQTGGSHSTSAPSTIEPDPPISISEYSARLRPDGVFSNAVFGIEVGVGSLDGNLDLDSGTRETAGGGASVVLEFGRFVADGLTVKGALAVSIDDVDNPVDEGELFRFVGARMGAEYYLNEMIWVSAGLGPAWFSVTKPDNADSTSDTSDTSDTSTITLGGDYGFGASGSIGCDFLNAGSDRETRLGLGLGASYALGENANASNLALLVTWRHRPLRTPTAERD